jgi:hypothetical protein
VPQAAQADDPDLVAGLHVPVLQRRIGGDAGAEDRRGGGVGQAVGDLQHEVLADHHDVGIAAQGVVAAVHVLAGRRLLGRKHRAIIGGQETIGSFAVVLLALLAGLAAAAAVDHAADADDVAFLKLDRACADPRHPAHDLVAGQTGIDGVLPLVLHLVNVRMADAAVEHLERPRRRRAMTFRSWSEAIG